MTGNIRKLMDDAQAASFDPSATYRASMRTMLEVMNGEIDNISPINPVVSVIETQAALMAAFAETLQADTRRLLQVNALDPADLYPHMADIHFAGIFNLPSSSVFTLILSKAEILSKMVDIPGTLSKKVTIPRNSYFSISDYVFGIHYPIDIVQQVHGALRVTYDTDVPTPLHVLETNALKYRFVERDGIEYLAIDIPVFQFQISSKTPAVTPAMTFSYNVIIPELYYATRVYRTLPDGTQEEIKVSYSEEIYDPLKPTAVVKILDDTVNIMIPQIYINSGLVQGELRIDVYSTKGPVSTTFDSYPIGSIGYRFRDLDKRAQTLFTAPMQKLGTCTLLAEQPVSGGVLAMSFKELREAVIADGIGDPSLPITPAQIKNYLNRKGYDIIKNTDIVTDRVFLATRNMPEPTNIGLLTAANASIETMNASFEDLVGNQSVLDNGQSVTISPKAVYRLEDGVLKMLSDSELEGLRSMRSDLLAAHVSNSNYLYSPYYYVLDKANNQFRLSPYYLDSPSVESQSFVADNEGTLLAVNTNGYQLIKNDAGYKLRIKTKSSDEFKELQDALVQCLLGFISPTEDDPCWIVGTLVSVGTDKERTFEFDLASRFSMNAQDRIDFRNFKLYDTTNKTIYSDLEQDFTVVYATTLQMGNLFVPGTIDAKLPRYLVPFNAVGINEEKLRLNFGKSLNNLWARARSLASTVTYETYPTDVILRYKEDVFKKDPVTDSDIFFVDGKPQRILLHAKGSAILDPEGKQIVQFPKGSVVLDAETGNPVIKDVRYLKHRFEMFFIEGVYLFSNDQIAIDYRNEVAKTVANWVTEDLVDIKKITMDKCNSYFYPKTVFGSVEVMISDSIVQSIPAGQSFDVSLYVPTNVNQNDELKKQLRKRTIEVIALCLKERTLAISDLVDKLKKAYGSDVIDVQISMFGPYADIPVMQVVNEIHRCGIRKRLVSRDDEKLVVEEAITVTYQTIQ
jgi:hypothetical protein